MADVWIPLIGAEQQLVIRLMSTRDHTSRLAVWGSGAQHRSLRGPSALRKHYLPLALPACGFSAHYWFQRHSILNVNTNMRTCARILTHTRILTRFQQQKRHWLWVVLVQLSLNIPLSVGLYKTCVLSTTVSDWQRCNWCDIYHVNNPHTSGTV